MGRVLEYIQKFRTLRYKIPNMIGEEAYTLFLRGLEAGIQQKVQVFTQTLQQSMELVERADFWSK